MGIEQTNVNVQDLQRLNQAIAATLDCIQRVAPQLALLSQQTLWPQPVPGIQFGYGFQPPVDPVAAAYVQGHIQALRTILGQQMQPTQGFGGFQQPWVMPQAAMAGLMQRPY